MIFSISAPPKEIASDDVGSDWQYAKWNQSIFKQLTVLFSVTLYIIWFIAWPAKPKIKEILISPTAYVFGFIALVAITILTHEIIHVAAAPKGFTSAKTVIGINIRECSFYTYIDSALSWRRSLIFLLSPFLVLTLIPTIAALTIGVPTNWVGVIAVCNAALSANDIIVSTYIIRHIPRSAIDVRPHAEEVRFVLKTAGPGAPS